MYSEYTIILKLIPRASKKVNDGHAVLRPDEALARCVHSPRFASLTQPQPLSLEQVQQLLDDGSLLVEYSLGEKRSYVWAVTRTSIKSFELSGPICHARARRAACPH